MFYVFVGKLFMWLVTMQSNMHHAWKFVCRLCAFKKKNKKHHIFLVLMILTYLTFTQHVHKSLDNSTCSAVVPPGLSVFVCGIKVDLWGDFSSSLHLVQSAGAALRGSLLTYNRLLQKPH